MVRDQHRRVIGRLVERFGQDPNFPALIVGGSVAKGWEQDDSDVDIMLLATDEEYARRAATRAFNYYTTDLCDYAGGYVDGKIVDWAFLQDVAAQGSEPARAAFWKAFVAYSRVPDLEALLARIAVYPEAERSERIRSFYAQVQALQWYVGEAEKRHDTYLMLRMVTELVLFGGRLILAHNRILYPYHKWFMQALEMAPAKPEGFVAQIEALLAQPSKARADAFARAVLSFTDWDKPPEGWVSRFLEDSEWTWRRGKSPVADL